MSISTEKRRLCMPDPHSVVLLKVDLIGYLMGLSVSVAENMGLKTDQVVNIGFGNKTWTGKFLIIPNLPPGNEDKLFLNANLSDPTPPDFTGISFYRADEVLRLGPVLAILAYRTGKPSRFYGEQTSFLKKLITIGRAMKMLVYVFSPDDVNWEKGIINGYSLAGDSPEETWQQSVYPFPDVIYDRGLFPPGDHRREAALLRKRFRSSAAVKYFNPAFFGKWKTHRWLAEHPSLRLHLPDTLLIKSIRDVITMADRYQEIYLKPIGGSSGRGIIKISREQDGTYICERRVKRITETLTAVDSTGLINILSPSLTAKKHVAQQGIRLATYQGRRFDVRALMQKNSSGCWVLTGMAARVAQGNAYITNVHAGGNAEKISTVIADAFSFDADLQEYILANIRRLSLLACTWIEEKTGQQFGEIAVDLGVAADGYIWFIELNAVPGRTVFRRIGATNIAARALTRPLEYARYLAGLGNTKPDKNKCGGA